MDEASVSTLKENVTYEADVTEGEKRFYNFLIPIPHYAK